MEPASAVAGFIALTALTAETAQKLTSLIQDIRGAPRRLEQ